MSRPSFQFYVKDFVAGTSMMSLDELGAYIRLLCLAWDQEPCGTLPDDEEKIRRMASADKEQWSTIRAAVMEKFPASEQFDGRRINKRLREQFDEVEDFVQRTQKGQKKIPTATRSAAGKKGAAARWGTSTNPGVREPDDIE